KCDRQRDRQPEFGQHQFPSLQPRRERRREARELDYGPDDGVRTRGRVSSAASRITRLAASSSTGAGGGSAPPAATIPSSRPVRRNISARPDATGSASSSATGSQA